jgi:hypothetical protein
MAQQNVLSSRPFVHVVFARTQAGNNALDILLKVCASLRPSLWALPALDVSARLLARFAAAD